MATPNLAAILGNAINSVGVSATFDESFLSEIVKAAPDMVWVAVVFTGDASAENPEITGDPINATAINALLNEKAGTLEPGESIVLSDAMYYTRPDHRFLPNTTADVRLSKAPDIDRSIPVDLASERRAQLSVSSFEFANGDRKYDSYPVSRSIDGQVCQFFLGKRWAPFEEFRLIAEVFGEDWEANAKKIRVPVTDASFLLDQPLLQSTYSGLDGINGDPELQGSFRPTGWGAVFNATPKLINRATLTYQFSDRISHSVSAVKDKAVPLNSSGIDVHDFAELAQVDLAADEYATCLRQSLFRLGSPPDFVTVDFVGDHDGSGLQPPTNTGAILARMARERAAIFGGSLNLNRFNLDSYEIGYFNDGSSQETVASVFNKLLRPSNAHYGSGRLRSLQLGKLIDPDAGAPTITLTDEDFVAEPERIRQPMPYRSKVTLNYGRNWTPMPEEMVSSSLPTETRRKHLLQYEGQVSASAGFTRLLHKTAKSDEVFDSYYTQAVDAKTVVSGVMGYLGRNLVPFRIKCSLKGLKTELNQRIQIKSSRFDLGDGRNVLILRDRLRAQKQQIEFEIAG